MAVTGYYAPSGSARSGVTIPRIGITVVLSIMVHLLLLWVINPAMRKPDKGADTHGDSRGTLSVEIAPRFRPPAPPVQRPSPTPVPQRSEPRAAPHKAPVRPPPPPPPVIARNTPAPEVPRVPVERPSPPQAPPSPAPRETDLAALLEARRRARGEQTASATPPAEPSPPVEDAKIRAQRIAEANLGTNRKPKFGERGPGGGVFQIRHMAYDNAEFAFYGWNPDIRRDTAQVIDVRKGDNPDIRIAVVRRMIAIIRSHKEDDFTWESVRLNRVVTKSARLKDSAELENFLMQEFFENDRRPLGRP